MPSEIRGYRKARLYQNSSWTRTGVPRKNQMYDPARAGEQRVGGKPHDREDHAEHDPDRHGDHGEQDCELQALQHPAGQEIAPDDVPLEAGVRHQGVREHRDQQQHNCRGQPPSRVADWHRLDLLRRPGAARGLRRRGVVTVAPGSATGPIGSAAVQLIAALIAGLEIAPARTPQLSRIFI